MCDELTPDELAAADVAHADVAAAHPGVTRRGFGALGGTAALVAAAPAFAQTGGPHNGLMKLTERKVAIPTPYGVADAFYVRPAAGVYPGILLWPDIGGFRDAFMIMARRLAGEGYAVLVINQYYRTSPAPVLATFAEWRTPAGQAKLKPMIEAITPEGTMRDAAAAIEFLDKQPGIDRKRHIGTAGFCMGGPFAVRTAASVSGRVAAAASLHGANLVNDTPDSPTHLLAKTKASFLFAIARNDDMRVPGDKDALRAAADAAHRPAEIEVYAADHGWTVPDSPSYDHAEAERAWTRMLGLFAGL